MITPPPAHLAEYKSWVVSGDGKAAGTAGIYSRHLARAAKFYDVRINERTVRTEADAQEIIGRVDKVVARRGRGAKGTFNTDDLTDNFIPAIRAYLRFVRANFPTVTSASRGRSKTAKGSGSPATTRRGGHSPTLNEAIAIDVPTDDLPKRLKSEVSRLIRNSKLADQIKQAHGHGCQVCGTRLELTPGIFYAEGHHLKPVGQPHNGPDKKQNILCVCPNCHAKLDFAAMKIDPAKLRSVPGHIVEAESINYHNALCRAAKQGRRG